VTILVIALVLLAEEIIYPDISKTGTEEESTEKRTNSDQGLTSLESKL